MNGVIDFLGYKSIWWVPPVYTFGMFIFALVAFIALIIFVSTLLNLIIWKVFKCILCSPWYLGHHVARVAFYGKKKSTAVAKRRQQKRQLSPLEDYEYEEDNEQDYV
jgi:fatty acid desaturase